MAGGIGKRMGNVALPKQYLMLGSKPIVVHTVEKFILNPAFDLILVSAPAQWVDYTNEILEKYHVHDDRLRVIAGGKERNDTLQLAIDFIEQANGLQDDDAIVAHDAVRPFITKRIIDDNIEALKTYKAVDTVVPAADTIVRGDGKQIADIPVREEMFQGQTPQSFNIKEFQRCYAALTDEQKVTLSDSAKIVLLNGGTVGMVAGELSNIKITTAFDLRIANAILATGHSAQDSADSESAQE
jgi:2-C-methyl-D-erythritol 4-phosphate cytidylyltransferase